MRCHISVCIYSLLQGCPALHLEFYRPTGFHSKPNKAHLNHQLEISLSCRLVESRLQNYGWSENLQDRESPETGLGTPGLLLQLGIG